MKRVIILFHERQQRRPMLMIQSLAEIWRHKGIEVVSLYGLGNNRPCADLLIPQVDLTQIPKNYQDYINSYPHVVNRGLTDISKRGISPNLLYPGDDYVGPVIIKTDRNCGGLPEIKLAKFLHPAMVRQFTRLLSWKESLMGYQLGKTQTLVKYPILPSLQDVPACVFDNPALIVERFRPEVEGDCFYTRHYVFLGDRFRSFRIGSHSPQVKSANSFYAGDLNTVPESIVQVRADLGMDYGKIDYTLNNGQVVLLDVNQTPGIPSTAETAKNAAKALADGINSLLPRSSIG